MKKISKKRLLKSLIDVFDYYYKREVLEKVEGNGDEEVLNVLDFIDNEVGKLEGGLR